MRRIKHKIVPPVAELGKSFEIPELPRTYRNKLWRTLKLKIHFEIPEETEHFMNMLCLHFGISRSHLFIHAINLLWNEFLETADPERIKLYEEKLEAVRLWRLESNEHRRNLKAQRMEEVIENLKKSTRHPKAFEQKATTWKYNRYVQRKKKPGEGKGNVVTTNDNSKDWDDI